MSVRQEGTRRRPTVEGLEGRRLLSSAVPDIRMISATTQDSRGVSFAFEVVNGPLQGPVTVGVYRSADDRYDPGDVPLGSMTVAPDGPDGPTLDEAGQPASAPGLHRVTLPLAGGLPPEPDHPHVLVVADPGHALAGSDPTLHTAGFRTHVVGVITHGGVQPTSWEHGPPWEIRMARGLREQGYDAVIAYNWVARSNHPGAATEQAPRLAREVVEAASRFPADEPVDVHFIGHSEGAVVNSLVLRQLEGSAPPQVRAGYLKETMLDPHSANNGVHGPQYSVSGGLLGWFARMSTDRFQSRAADPPAFVPGNVDEAEVFFQHTPVSQAQAKFAWPGTIPRSPLHSPINLWGQVPVAGPAHYFNLTAPGISHSGHFGVQDWYRLNVVPTLGHGAPSIRDNVLTVQPGLVRGTAGANDARTSDSDHLTYSGTSAPGATVRLVAAHAGSDGLVPLGEAVADAGGTWSLTTRPLPRGRYRALAMADVPESPGRRPVFMRPTAWAAPIRIE